MTSYMCNECSKTFTQKIYYEAHMKSTNPCKKTPKKDLGQYFTVSEDLQRFVFDNVKYKGECLLEPSFGAGHLLKLFKEYDNDYPMVCCEIDTSIKPVVTFNEHQTVMYGDFTDKTLDTKFKTIVGNPPYVKQSSGNLYIKFIEMCYDYLADDGELVFIVPSDFIKLTSASAIIDTMTRNGSFTHFLFPHNERLFENANIDVVVFRYEKGCVSDTTIVNGETMICNVNNGIITFSDTKVEGDIVSDLFNVYVGIVSGRDEIYKVPFGNIEVLTDKDRCDKFIFTDVFPTEDSQINKHLLDHKSDLMERRIKKFSESNWFEWGAPRNISSIRKYWGTPCVYVRNMTRNSEVAFVGKVQYFGGTLLCLVPKKTMSMREMNRIVEYINSASFKKDYMYAGRFKIGHKQISNAIIPN